MFIEGAQYRWVLDGLGRFELSEKCGDSPGKWECPVCLGDRQDFFLPLYNKPFTHPFFMFITSFSKLLPFSYSGSNTPLSLGVG